MTIKLNEVYLNVGERRVGRLMKLGGIKPVRTRKHKVTTDSHHRLGVAANQKWGGDLTYIWTSRAGSIVINRKMTQRIYREEKRAVRRRRNRPVTLAQELRRLCWHYLTSGGAWTSCMIKWRPGVDSECSTSSTM